jgi:serine kinase of HPr protein (carbohydrate metabolism regulator)
MAQAPSVHASAVLAGARAILIRGPAGSGKSRLALRLIQAGQTGLLRFARLIGDDRVILECCHGRLLVRAAGSLTGLLEMRGVGIRKLELEPAGVVGMVVDLGVAGAQRLPDQTTTTICGVQLPALAFPTGVDALPWVIGAFTSTPGNSSMISAG